MDEKQLKILLMFGADSKSAQEAFTRLQQRIEALKKRAVELRANLNIFRSTQQDASALENELEQVNKELADTARVARIAEKSLGGMSQSSRDARDNLYHLRDIGEKLNMVGGNLRNWGQMLTGPFLQASQTFLATIHQADPLAVAWKSEMAEIQESWLRIGRVATEELLPLLEKAADFSGSLADFVEQNPGLVKAALGAGMGLQAVGALTQMAGMITSLTGVLKGLGVGGLLGKAGGAVGGLAASSGGAVLGGLGLGFGGYELLAKSELGQKAGLANMGQWLSVASYGAGNLFGGMEQGDRWFRWMGELTGVIEKQADAAERAAGSGDDAQNITQQQLDAFSAYQQAQSERAAFEQQSEAARNQIVADYSKRRLALETDYENQRNALLTQYGVQRAQMLSDYAMSEARAEQDYYVERARLAQRHNQDAQRMEAEHQRDLRQMQRDHNDRVNDLVGERDALGLAREQRDYERQRQDAEGDYQQQAKQRHQDFALQVQEMEQNFALQRARRAEDFNRQLSDFDAQHQERLAQIDAQHAVEMEQLEAQHKERLDQFEKGYAAELAQLQTAEQNRLNTLRSLALNDQAALEQAGMELTTRYIEWLQQAVGAVTSALPSHYYDQGLTGRAAGGWVNAFTPYLVGERGPEIFTPPYGGNITPNHRILSNAGGAAARGGDSLNLRVETASLTLQQVIGEIDKRLARHSRALAGAFV